MTAVSHRIETNEAERIGIAPTARAARTSRSEAPGLRRGVFIGWSRPSVHTTRLAMTAGAGSARAYVASACSSAVGSATVSSSISHTRSGSCFSSARSMPAANPPAPPVFSPNVTTSRPSYAASTSAVPSLEALSTTTVAATGLDWSRTASSASTSRSRRFHVTTTATTRGTACMLCSTSGRRSQHTRRSAHRRKVLRLVGLVLRIAGLLLAVSTIARGFRRALAFSLVDRVADHTAYLLEVGIRGVDLRRHDRNGGHLVRLRLEREVDERIEILGRNVGAQQPLAGLGDVVDIGQHLLRAELIQHGTHHALLPRHARVVVRRGAAAREPQRVEPVDLLLAGLDVTGDRAADTADREALGYVERQAADGVHEVLETLQVDHRVVVDLQTGGLLHRLLGRLDPGVLDIVVEDLLVLTRPGVDAVQVPAVPVEPLRETLVHRRPLGERDAFEVARQGHEHRKIGRASCRESGE